MLSEFKSDIEKTVTSTFEKMRGVGDKEISTEAVADIGTVRDGSKIFESFLWINPRDKKGAGQPKFHPIRPYPEFELPKVGCGNIWMLWHFGNAEKKYGPYCHITCLDLCLKREVVQLSKIRKVMDWLLDIAISHNYIGQHEKVGKLSELEGRRIFDLAYRDFLEELFGEDNLNIAGYGNQAIATLYDLKLKTEQTKKENRKRTSEEVITDEQEVYLCI